MISESNIKNQIVGRRLNQKKNYSCLNLPQWGDIGEGEDFSFSLLVHVNKNTGNVSMTHSVRFRGAKTGVCPGTNCGKIDVSDIPDSVLNRYRGYELKRYVSRSVSRCKRRKHLRS